MSLADRILDLPRRMRDGFSAYVSRSPIFRASIVVLAGAIGAVFYFARRAPEPHSTLDFVTRHSHVALPEPLRDSEDVDNAQSFGAHYAVLPAGAGHQLADREHFEACAARALAHFDVSMFQIERHRALPSRDRLRCLRGSAHQCITWTYAVDPSTDRLWVNVTYPDWGGMPRCDDDPRGPAEGQ